MTDELLSIRGYARHRKDLGLPGGTHAAVRKAIATGRLDAAVRIREGKPRIDANAADLEWASRTDPVQSRNPEQAGDPTQGRPFGGLEGSPRDDARASDEPDIAETARKAQAVRLTFQAKIAELEYRERARELVKAEEVRHVTTRAARKVRDRLRSIPDRLASRIAAETDPHRCRLLLQAEIDRSLQDLLEDFRRDGNPL